jgi:regulator of RNase E activity RraA
MIISKMSVSEASSFHGKSKYGEIYRAAETLSIGEAMKVNLDYPNKSFGNAITGHAIKHNLEYRFSVIKQNKEGSVWVVKKISKRSGW